MIQLSVCVCVWPHSKKAKVLLWPLTFDNIDSNSSTPGVHSLLTAGSNCLKKNKNKCMQWKTVWIQSTLLFNLTLCCSLVDRCHVMLGLIKTITVTVTGSCCRQRVTGNRGGEKKHQNEMEVPCKQAGLMSHSGPRWKDLCLFVQSKQLNRSVENVMLSKSEFTIDQFLWRCWASSIFLSVHDIHIAWFAFDWAAKKHTHTYKHNSTVMGGTHSKAQHQCHWGE